MLLLNNRRGAIRGAKVLGVGAGPALPRPRPGQGRQGPLCVLPALEWPWLEPVQLPRRRQEEEGCIDSLPALLRLTFSGLKIRNTFPPAHGITPSHTRSAPPLLGNGSCCPLRGVSWDTCGWGQGRQGARWMMGRGAAGVSRELLGRLMFYFLIWAGGEGGGHTDVVSL